MPFEHEIINLSDKPPRFLELYERAAGGSETAKVPLLELFSSGGSDVVIESEVVARRIATEYQTGSELLPPGDASHVDRFIKLWTGRVETTYYKVLRADCESSKMMHLAEFCASLAEVESALWERRVEGRR